MNKVSFATRLEQLLLLDSRIPKRADDEVNVAKAASIIGIGQSTLQRMLAGNSELPSRSNAEVIMQFLSVTFGQLIGTEALPGDAEAVLDQASKQSVADDAEQARALAARLQPSQVRSFIRPLVEHLGDSDRLMLIRMIAQPEHEGA